MDKNDLGRVGVWTFAFDGMPATLVREAAAELEELGYGAIWYGEAFGRDSVGQAWLLLAATRRIVVASGIANVSRREPLSLALAERALGEAFPDRYLLGLGGHRVSTKPTEFLGYPMPPVGPALRMMRGYLDAMDAVPVQGPVPDPAPRRVLAALGPRMLELAAERTWGAHPYFVTTEHTARAREIMGPEAFLAVEQAVVLDADLGRAREVARDHFSGYMEFAPHQRANVERLGFGEDDIAGPSDRLVNAIVSYGDLDAIQARVREHLDAGADHVCLQVLTASPEAPPLREWRELAAAVL
ncbi:TIGR03620 family F420-dependent LLM class oxidoreductase [Actinomadura roseirufa]|uniref:TIGR03620 family F420-dependent LLM class oxidoreductase n=1 Tax=Actinomadura roseirufa TaxID=2094049 RepID=UPI001041084B|nr:TIGR03620 family F420-dependent LLM class oxidoreductase [Actinomadura roseirufa]